MSGLLEDPLTGEFIHHPSPVGGATHLGFVTHSWIDKKTDALHFAGIIKYDPDSVLATYLEDNKTYQACSLQYCRADPSVHQTAAPIELSICHTPRWPETFLWIDGDLDTYMRKTGFQEYNQMATPAPPAAQDPAASAEQQARDAAGRFAARDAGAGAGAATAPSDELEPAEADEHQYKAAFDSTPPLVQNLFNRVSDDNESLRSENENLKKRVFEIDAQVEEQKQKRIKDRLELFGVFKDYASQHPSSVNRALQNVDMASVAASNDPGHNALWELVAAQNAEHAAKARAAAAPPTPAPTPAPAPPTRRPEFVRPGMTKPSADDLAKRATRYQARTTPGPVPMQQSQRSIMPDTVKATYEFGPQPMRNIVPLRNAFKALCSRTPEEVQRDHDSFSNYKSHEARNMPTAADEFYMPIGQPNSRRVGFIEP